MLMNTKQFTFTEFCVLEYLEYLEGDQKEKLSFDEYISEYRYWLLEKWRHEASPTIH